MDLKEDRQLQKGVTFDTLLDEIRVENLSFSYDKFSGENKRLLNSVSLTIKRGEKVAFVGESGSGKSTLAKTLIGLLKYEEGDILFDHKPLKNISLESLYEKTSYHRTHPYLTVQSEKIWYLTGTFRMSSFMRVLKMYSCRQCLHP